MKIEELSGAREPVPMMRQYAMAEADASTPVAAGELEIQRSGTRHCGDQVIRKPVARKPAARKPVALSP